MRENQIMSAADNPDWRGYMAGVATTLHYTTLLGIAAAALAMAALNEGWIALRTRC